MRARSSSTRGLGSRPGNNSPRARNKKSVLARSARIASSTPGYCTFTATRSPVARYRPVHLPDRRRRDRDGIPFREDARRHVAEFGRARPRCELGRHRRRVLLQRRERIAHRLRQTVVEIADHLPDLHQAPFSSPSTFGDVGGAAQLVRGCRARRGVLPTRWRAEPGARDAAVPVLAPINARRALRAAIEFATNTSPRPRTRTP